MPKYRAIMVEFDPETGAKSIRDIAEYNALSTDNAVEQAFDRLHGSAGPNGCYIEVTNTETRGSLGKFDPKTHEFLTDQDVEPVLFRRALDELDDQLKKLYRLMLVGEDMGIKLPFSTMEEGLHEQLADRIADEHDINVDELSAAWRKRAERGGPND